eukprot:205511-Amphidinium_carterae.1
MLHYMFESLGCPVRPVSNAPQADASILLRADLLESWRMLANDPDVEVPRWIHEGAPAGIMLSPSQLSFLQKELNLTSSGRLSILTTIAS